MNLFALSDIHLADSANRAALDSIKPRPHDWFILAGDVGETYEHLEFAFKTLAPRFKQLVWVPGNHELWTLPALGANEKGQRKYERLVDLCRAHGVLTPEDPYPVVTISDQRFRIAPLFLLYDYSFRPDHVSLDGALAWAAESGIVCTDEHLLHCDPFADVVRWCGARCEYTEKRLEECMDGLPTVLINHWPLREDLARVPMIPRFSIWCGTRRTGDWHIRFNAKVVVSGHLHIRSTRYRDGVRFEEVSLGYSRQWSGFTTIEESIRKILPQA